MNSLPQGILCTLLAIGACNTLQAETHKEFTKGLEMLAKVGLPDMKGAQWVAANGEGDGDMSMSGYQLQQLQIGMKGSNWKLENPPRTLGMGSGIAKPIVASSDNGNDESSSGGRIGILRRSARNTADADGLSEKNDDQQATEKLPLVRSDTLKIITSLKNPEIAENLNNNMRWMNEGPCGMLLVFAAQLHQAGETESAGELAAALFNAIDDDEKIIDQAIELLAGEQYHELVSGFFENHDWQAYHDGIRALISRFPRGWSDNQAAAILAARISGQGKSKWQPKIDGIQLNPKAVQLMEQLIEIPKTVEISDEELIRMSGHRLEEIPARFRPRFIANLRREHSGGLQLDSDSLWLLEKPETSDKSGPIEQLKSLGMEGMITIAAYLGDETLTCHPRGDNNRFGYSSSSDDDPLERYDRMPRPISRGEIATQLLSMAIPLSDESHEESINDPARLRELAIAFYKKHHRSSASELAVDYISHGNSTQNHLAAAALINLDTPEGNAAFEKATLSAEEPLRMYSLVESYLGQRKAKAKEFTKAYITLLRNTPVDSETLSRMPGGYNMTANGGIENQINKLNLLIGDISLDTLIQQALQAKAPATENNPSDEPTSPILALGGHLGEMETQAIMSAFAKVADKTTPQQWLEIHEVLLRHFGNFSYHPDEEDQQTAPAKDTLTPETLQAWNTLRNRSEPVSSNPNTQWINNTRQLGINTIGDLTTLLLDFTMDPTSFAGMIQLVRIQDDNSQLMKRIHQRVNDRLAGKPPQPWPDAEKVTGERLKEITDKITTLPQDQIISWCSALNDDERLALATQTQEWFQSDAVPENLATLNKTIVNTGSKDDEQQDTKLIDAIGIKPGTHIDAALLTRISDAMLRDPEIVGSSLVIIQPASMMLGSKIRAMTPRSVKDDRQLKMYLRSMAYQFMEQQDADVMCCIQISNAQFLRTIKDGRIIEMKGNSEQQKTLEEAFEESKKSTFHYVILSLDRKQAETIIN